MRRTGEEFPSRPESWHIDVYKAGGVPVEAFNAGPSFKSGSTPAGSIRLGRGTVTGGAYGPLWRLIDKAKREARELGGDAIVIRQHRPVRGTESLMVYDVYRYHR
jgi:hypothetical protein